MALVLTLLAVSQIFDATRVLASALTPGSVGVSAVTLRLPATQTRQYDTIRADGFGAVRLLVEWPLIEPHRRSYDWTMTDKLVHDAAARGLTILGVLTYAPAWAALTPQPGQVHPAPRDTAAWADFVSIAAQRYRGVIKAWEVWNEPNVFASFAPAPDAARYADMLIRANTAIKEVDPTAQVLTGGTSPTIDGGGEIAPATFIAQLYLYGAGDSFDHVAMHPYSTPGLLSDQGGWYSSHNAIGAVSEVLTAHGQGNKQIWFTEFGAPTIADGGRGVTDARQAEILSDGITYLRSLKNAGPIFVFDYMDIETGSPNAEFNYGLRRSDFSPKPALAAVQSLAVGRWR
jgi:hypothetical protein